MRVLRFIAIALAFAVLGGVATPVRAQLDVQVRHNTGQSVVPVFQGWEKGPNGTFYMVFGYFNRNFAEELSVPVGPQNGFSPGTVDQGQPGYFYAGVNRYIFRVQVPADFGKKELMWTVAAYGKTEKAVASLLPEWEIDPTVEFGGGGSARNQPPTLKLSNTTFSVSLPTPLALTTVVADDGKPESGGRGGGVLNQGPDAFPALHKGARGPTNVPLLRPMPQPGRGGLSVGWVVYRGPGHVEFTRESQPGQDARRAGNFAPFPSKAGGQVTTLATFQVPGTYVLRALAGDGQLRAIQDVTVQVSAARDR